jgi:hypothetical protein
LFHIFSYFFSISDQDSLVYDYMQEEKPLKSNKEMALRHLCHILSETNPSHSASYKSQTNHFPFLHFKVHQFYYTPAHHRHTHSHTHSFTYCLICAYKLQTTCKQICCRIMRSRFGCSSWHGQEEN